MIVRNFIEAFNSERRITSADGNWDSTRLLLKDDQMGFSFHITRIFKGANFKMHYQNHLESVYCINGSGEIENLDDGEKYPINPGTIYILDKHDKHVLHAFEEMMMACVFNPPLNGKEIHNADGAYELDAESLSIKTK